MPILSKFLSANELSSLCKNQIIGRVLSLNTGKNIWVGVIHCASGFFMYNFELETEKNIPFARGDIIYFRGKMVRIADNKLVIKIECIDKVICCNGELPNKAFNDKDSNQTIVSTMFTPEKFEMLRLKNLALEKIRFFLYSEGYMEIHTPILSNYRAPSNATPFKVKTVNGRILYMKTIHEHLLKPYMLLGYEKIFEIGSVFRDIGYDPQYDCEFTNIDIWAKHSTVESLIELCKKIFDIARNCFGVAPLEELIMPYSQFVIQEGIEAADKNATKRFIAENGLGKFILLYDYPRGTNSHIKQCGKNSNLEFHAYANGYSFAHAYVVETQELSKKEMASDVCQIFEEYASLYGVEEFGGVGIGYEKLIQAVLGKSDFHLGELYKRKY